MKGNLLLLESIVILKNGPGIELNGLPNLANAGATSKTAYDLNGTVLQANDDGIESDGVPLALDGTFWLSNQYKPHNLHVDRYGKTMEKIIPFGTGTSGRK